MAAAAAEMVYWLITGGCLIKGGDRAGEAAALTGTPDAVSTEYLPESTLVVLDCPRSP